MTVGVYGIAKHAYLHKEKSDIFWNSNFFLHIVECCIIADSDSIAAGVRCAYIINFRRRMCALYFMVYSNLLVRPPTFLTSETPKITFPTDDV